MKSKGMHVPMSNILYSEECKCIQDHNSYVEQRFAKMNGSNYFSYAPNIAKFHNSDQCILVSSFRSA